MRAVISAVLFFAIAANAGALEAQSTAPGSTPAPLPDNQCLRISRISEWHVINDQTVIVQAGPYSRYLVKLQAACQKLGIGRQGLMFLASPAEKATQPDRICGSLGERVRARNQPPCAIQSLSVIDQPTFDGLRAKAKYNSSRTQPPSKSP